MTNWGADYIMRAAENARQSAGRAAPKDKPVRRTARQRTIEKIENGLVDYENDSRTKYICGCIVYPGGGLGNLCQYHDGFYDALSEGG